jgi:hypothetical protein
MMESRNSLHPHRPSHIPDYAELCLHTLVNNGLNDKISLRGAFGLLHYLEYRPTHDVDAWWIQSATSRDKEQVTQVLEEALGPYGAVRSRTWGDVVSIELVQGETVVFSFQIAQRSAQLEPSVSAVWIDVPLDSFPDLVASKMVALVERGAPRDFRDIYALCQNGLTTPEQCWQLWQQRQKLAGSDTDTYRARLAVETHLTRITLHRPVNQISDPGQRAEAEQVRTWFEEEFLDALVD